MAIFHLSIKIISRSKGKSAVAASAYRAGEKLTETETGYVHDYTRKEGVIHTEFFFLQMLHIYFPIGKFYGTRYRRLKNRQMHRWQGKLK